MKSNKSIIIYYNKTKLHKFNYKIKKNKLKINNIKSQD